MSERSDRSSGRDGSLEELRELLDAAGIGRALKRIAHEIVERNAAAGKVTLVGIRTAGVPLAERLASIINETGDVHAELGAIDITLYRDDVFEGLPKPEVGGSEMPGHTIAGKTVILVDDVLYTGRTIRAALDALMDYGRPRAVQLAVLVDRGHRELPIQPDYVGSKVETTRQQSVKVILDGRDRAVLRQRKPEAK